MLPPAPPAPPAPPTYTSNLYLVPSSSNGFGHSRPLSPPTDPPSPPQPPTLCTSRPSASAPYLGMRPWLPRAMAPPSPPPAPPRPTDTLALTSTLLPVSPSPLNATPTWPPCDAPPPPPMDCTSAARAPSPSVVTWLAESMDRLAVPPLPPVLPVPPISIVKEKLASVLTSRALPEPMPPEPPPPPTLYTKIALAASPAVAMRLPCRVSEAWPPEPPPPPLPPMAAC